MNDRDIKQVRSAMSLSKRRRWSERTRMPLTVRLAVVSITMEEAGLRDVVKRALRGCPEAFSKLYASHYRHVLWVCRRFFWQPEDAEDAAAEVFLKLHRVLGSHDPSLPFRPWLSQVASRQCIDELRRRAREQRHCVKEDEIAALPDVSTASPLARVLRDEEQRQVREELNRLPEHYRLPLVLRYYKQMSYNEIARTLGRRLPVVKMILFRAKKELRRKLMRSKGAARSARLSGRCVFASLMEEAALQVLVDAQSQRTDGAETLFEDAPLQSAS